MRSHLVLPLLVLASLAAAACSSGGAAPAEPTQPGASASEAGPPTSATPAVDAAGAQGTAPPSTMDARAPSSVDTLVHFDPSKGELPEGLAFRDGVTYVGFAPGAAIVKVPAGGAPATFATVPSTFGGTKGFTLGLGFDPSGTLYALEASFDPSMVQAGVYKIPATGGAVTAPWAKDPAMTFPNGIAFDAKGAAFVADSAGFIFKIDEGGAVTTWSADPLLKGDPKACPGLLPIPIGANGIAVTPTDVWVTNTDKGSLLRFPIDDAGKPGPVRSVLGGCEYAGADGVVFDAKSASLIVAINGQNKVIRVTEDGVASTLWSGAPLDFPASLWIEGDALLITGAAFASAQTAGGKPAPALLKYAPFF